MREFSANCLLFSYFRNNSISSGSPRECRARRMDRRTLWMVDVTRFLGECGCLQMHIYENLSLRPRYSLPK